MHPLNTSKQINGMLLFSPSVLRVRFSALCSDFVLSVVRPIWQIACMVITTYRDYLRVATMSALMLITDFSKGANSKYVMNVSFKMKFTVATLSLSCRLDRHIS